MRSALRDIEDISRLELDAEGGVRARVRLVRGPVPDLPVLPPKRLEDENVVSVAVDGETPRPGRCDVRVDLGRVAKREFELSAELRQRRQNRCIPWSTMVAPPRNRSKIEAGSAIPVTLTEPVRPDFV